MNKKLDELFEMTALHKECFDKWEELEATINEYEELKEFLRKWCYMVYENQELHIVTDDDVPKEKIELIEKIIKDK